MQRSERVVRLSIAAALVAVVFVLSCRRPPAKENFGYTPNPEGVEQFLRELEQPLFAQAGAEAIREAKGEDTFLYRALYKAHLARYQKPFLVGSQGIGDCVSWGWAHGVWISQAIDWDLGRLPEPPLAPATESVYGGSRVEARNKPEGGGGWSDGSYGAAAARWCRDWGVIYREKVLDHDLTTYSAKRAKDWGNYGNGGQGDRGKLDAEAKRHPAKYVSLVKTWNEAAAAIESGYPVVVCSMVGFTSIRDADGFCRASGTWAHCMCFIGVRYGDRPGLLCLNSWGPTYVGGPRWPDDMPDGSFWVEKAVADRMLSAGDSFAVGSIDGFGFRDLHHGNWFEPPPFLNAETIADDPRP